MSKMKDAYEAAKPAWPIVVGVGILGATAGAAASHILTKQKLEAEFEKRLELELNTQAKLEEDKAELPVVEVVVEEPVLEVIEESEHTAYDRLVEEYAKEDSGIYVPEGNPDGAFDYAVEKELRSPEAPYVVTEEEYGYTNDGLTNACLTYYVGDGVLVDDEMVPVDDVEYLVGKANLEKFGLGSSSNDVVHIRNEKIDMEFEVERDPHSYSTWVLGGIPEDEDE